LKTWILGIGINFKIKPYKLANTIKKTPNFYGVTTLVKKNGNALPLVQQFLHELENVFHLINSGRVKKIKNFFRLKINVRNKIFFFDTKYSDNSHVYLPAPPLLGNPGATITISIFLFKFYTLKTIFMISLF